AGAGLPEIGGVETGERGAELAHPDEFFAAGLAGREVLGERGVLRRIEGVGEEGGDAAVDGLSQLPSLPSPPAPPAGRAPRYATAILPFPRGCPARRRFRSPYGP